MERDRGWTNNQGFLSNFLKINSAWTFPFIKYWKLQKSLVFVTNSGFLIPIFLQTNVIDLRYFKLWILLNHKIKVWNIKGLLNSWLQRYRDSKIWAHGKDSIPFTSFWNRFLWWKFKIKQISVFHTCFLTNTIKLLFLIFFIVSRIYFFKKVKKCILSHELVFKFEVSALN